MRETPRERDCERERSERERDGRRRLLEMGEERNEIGLQRWFYTVFMGLGFVSVAGGLLWCCCRGPRWVTGTRDTRNVPVPGSPDGDNIWFVKIPTGTKNTPFTSPNG